MGMGNLLTTLGEEVGNMLIFCPDIHHIFSVHHRESSTKKTSIIKTHKFLSSYFLCSAIVPLLKFRALPSLLNPDISNLLYKQTFVDFSHITCGNQHSWQSYRRKKIILSNKVTEAVLVLLR